MEIHKWDGYSWNIIAVDLEINLRNFYEKNPQVFYNGRMLVCPKNEARYKESVVRAGLVHELYVQEEGVWALVKSGTPDEIMQLKSAVFEEQQSALSLVGTAVTRMKAAQVETPKPAAPVEEPKKPAASATPVLESSKPAPVEKPKPVTTGKIVPVDEVVWSKIKDVTWLRKEDVIGYLYQCAIRNRSVGRLPVFDSRLHDLAQQPIYIMDMGWDAREKSRDYIESSTLKVCCSLTDVQRIRPEIKELPPPIQWSDDVSRYFWDPTTKMAPIDMNALNHILDEHRERFPEELHAKSNRALVEIILKAAVEGAAMACRDSHYALPTYFGRHDDIGMMLPIYVPLIFDEKPVAALVVRKWATGYRVSSILKIDDAIRSASLFCNPRNTWLKECY